MTQNDPVVQQAVETSMAELLVKQGWTRAEAEAAAKHAALQSENGLPESFYGIRRTESR